MVKGEQHAGIPAMMETVLMLVRPVAEVTSRSEWGIHDRPHRAAAVVDQQRLPAAR
jgi:hypothetical protein